MSVPWHIRWLNLEDGLWEQTKGEGARVALLDSGVADISVLDHDKLRRLTHEGEPARARDRSANGHGTAVAGIVSARHRRTPGIAPEADCLCLDVYGVDGRPSDYRAAEAMKFVAQSGEVDLVCCTFTFRRVSDELSEGLAALREANIPVLIASGNRRRETSAFPEELEGVTTVGAMTSSSRMLSNSRFGDWTTVAAPGMRIATWRTSGRVDRQFTGTSAAAPVLTGVCALLLAQARSLGGDAAVDAVRGQLHQLIVDSSETKRRDVPFLDVEALTKATLNLAKASQA